MLINLFLFVTISGVFATAVANSDINIKCLKNSVRITWTIHPELVPHAARFFLGNCMATNLNVLQSEEGQLSFESDFSDCRFKRQIKGKNVHFQNVLTYRPYAKSQKPAAYVYPVKCVRRRAGWIPPFLNKGSGVSENWSGLVFHMALLNENITGLAKTNVVPLGSFMPIWAAVEQKSHQPLLLLMDECVAASTAELQPDTEVYTIIGNKGCLSGGFSDHARFLPRYHSSALTLYLQSFKVPDSNEVYIHCNLIVWDPEALGEDKKACNYITETGSWELLDDPSRSSLCSCCRSTCKSRSKRGVSWGSNAFSHKSVLGPLIIVDPFEVQETTVRGDAVGSQQQTASAS